MCYIDKNFSLPLSISLHFSLSLSIFPYLISVNHLYITIQIMMLKKMAESKLTFLSSSVSNVITSHSSTRNSETLRKRRNSHRKLVDCSWKQHISQDFHAVLGHLELIALTTMVLEGKDHRKVRPGKCCVADLVQYILYRRLSLKPIFHQEVTKYSLIPPICTSYNRLSLHVWLSFA